MFSKVCLFLLGAGYIYNQIVSAEEVYIAELMVESNYTLEASTILSALNISLQVNDRGHVHNVEILQSELVAECIIIGDESNCNCSVGFGWSNEVCYSSNCCNETTCKQNVSHITPLCIAKVKVQISGSVLYSTWNATKTTQLQTALGRLNGYVNNTLYMSNSNQRADFEATFSVRLNTSILQDIVTDLESSLETKVRVNTVGMVTMESPQAPVCYQSKTVMNCTFEEATDSAGWKMTKNNSSYDLNNGSVVELDHNCATSKYNSCTKITLTNVTDALAGTYECGFTRGSVTHTATAQLNVALLPDEIIMESFPQTVDCSNRNSCDIFITASFPKINESLNFSWMGTDIELSNQTKTFSEDSQKYSLTAKVKCNNMVAKNVSIIFTNMKGQEKHAHLDIPVIYADGNVCTAENDSGVLWPKTPDGATVIIRTCAEDRAGYKSRNCNGNGWSKVFNYCVSQQLKNVFYEAQEFGMGVGATQEIAMDIFQGLKNSSTFGSDPDEYMADIYDSINILNLMAKASENFVIDEAVFQNFADAASNLLNSTWEAVNSSFEQSMSSNFLESVEGLVNNIRVNTTSKIISHNLDFKVCSSAMNDCNVFNTSVELLPKSGKMKTVAVKNLMDKLDNNFHETYPLNNPLLVIATLQDSNGSNLEITLEFLHEQLQSTKPFCVFWNTAGRNWSHQGCTTHARGDTTVCKCNHLTSFSVLMSKRDTSNYVLDVITYVGLGVSIFSLVIFLIVESIVWSVVVKTNLSHFRHTALVNIATFLLLADCSFLASTSPKNLPANVCLSLTICKHLFYLVMFSWMLCMSVMLVHQLIFVFSPLRKRVFMFFSSIVGYVCPCLIVAFSYFYCKYTNKQYHNDKCWLVFNKLLDGSIHAFLIPVATIIFTNVFSMMVVIFTLLKSTVPDDSKANEKATAKSILKVVVFLTPVFGVTWGIGFLLLMLNEEDDMHAVANYAFTILNSFQGFFVMLTGCLAEQKVRAELSKIIMGKGKSDSMKNLTSATYTKDK